MNQSTKASNAATAAAHDIADFSVLTNSAVHELDATLRDLRQATIKRTQGTLLNAFELGRIETIIVEIDTVFTGRSYFPSRYTQARPGRQTEDDIAKKAYVDAAERILSAVRDIVAARDAAVNMLKGHRTDQVITRHGIDEVTSSRPGEVNKVIDQRELDHRSLFAHRGIAHTINNETAAVEATVKEAMEVAKDALRRHPHS